MALCPVDKLANNFFLSGSGSIDWRKTVTVAPRGKGQQKQ
jgi:hypothetical protein